MKKILSICLSILMVFSTLTAFAGCSTPGQQLNTETRPLMLAIGAVDGNFNPFFSTTLNDGEIAGMTQVALMTSNEDGDVTCGDDWPTVALDYKKTYYDSKTGGSVIQEGSVEGRTEYEFLIKNGMKFSDGHPLTIKDVLFSLYVYLDPAYTGSATIYSTDIQGLKAYRAQDPTLADDSEASSDTTFYAEAQGRIYKLVEWSSEGTLGEEPSTEQMKKDLATVKQLFMEEATSDWVATEQSWEESYSATSENSSYNFTSAWQAYLYTEGLVREQTRMSDLGGVEKVKDDNGRYVTTLDPDIVDGEVKTTYAEEIAEATTSNKINAYMSANDCDEEYAKLMLEKEYCVNLVYNSYTTQRKIFELLTYGWATGSKAIEQFAGEARTAYFESLKEQGKGVSSISGITTYNTREFKGKNFTEDHAVLKIVVNGVDPKAIWNFCFNVSPLHYYAGTEYANQANNVDNFGVETGNSEFFNKVLKATNKNGIPVGAGAYMAANEYGNSTNVATDFNKNNIIRFVRNPYFETMGANISNAKIKYLNYKVLGDSKIMSALTSGAIDFGTPNSKSENYSILQNNKSLTQFAYFTAGYGYVGVNPKFVPDVNIRRAIMKAMDTASICNNYYVNDMATPIYRPMSSTSWAYPQGIGVWDERELYSEHWGTTINTSIKFDNSTESTEIMEYVEMAGYSMGADGKLRNSSGETLTYTFTIAGESNDHPAYQMFLDAADILNNLGFDISVKPDIQALKKMTTGDLAVWAAAWSSGIDPDMYQVYHKDSKATSVKNWGYDVILNDTQGIYAYERFIINALSEKIEAGRETENESLRTQIYGDCLDLVMELAVELPTYQRKDICAYNNKVIAANSVNNNPDEKMGVIAKIWEVNYV